MHFDSISIVDQDILARIVGLCTQRSSTGWWTTRRRLPYVSGIRADRELDKMSRV